MNSILNFGERSITKKRVTIYVEADIWDSFMETCKERNKKASRVIDDFAKGFVDAANSENEESEQKDPQ